MSNLVKLLQPKEYKSKIKLFCREKEFKTENFIEKFGNLNNNSYICKQGTSPRKNQIKIEEL